MTLLSVYVLLLLVDAQLQQVLLRLQVVLILLQQVLQLKLKLITLSLKVIAQLQTKNQILQLVQILQQMDQKAFVIMAKKLILHYLAVERLVVMVLLLLQVKKQMQRAPMLWQQVSVQKQVKRILLHLVLEQTLQLKMQQHQAQTLLLRVHSYLLTALLLAATLTVVSQVQPAVWVTARQYQLVLLAMNAKFKMLLQAVFLQPLPMQSMVHNYMRLQTVLKT